MIKKLEGRRSIGKAKVQARQVHRIHQAQKTIAGPDTGRNRITKTSVVVSLGVAVTITLIALLKAMKALMEVKSGCIDTNMKLHPRLAIPTILVRRSMQKEGKARMMRVSTLLKSITSFLILLILSAAEFEYKFGDDGILKSYKGKLGQEE